MTSESDAVGSRRVIIYFVLVACFFVQSAFVYLDYPRRGHGQELSAQARQGLDIWRRHNCQVCHQIYGFGGFLGPDLTNIMSRRPGEDWSPILTVGRKQMPAFRFDESAQAAIVQFLTELDQTGQGVPHMATAEQTSVDRLVQGYQAASGHAVPDPVARGEELSRGSGCGSCHRPFAVGSLGAPDLTTVCSSRSPAELWAIVSGGKGTMPAYVTLTEEQIGDVVAWLTWMNENRRELGIHNSRDGGDGTFRWARVPWFEYPTH